MGTEKKAPTDNTGMLTGLSVITGSGILLGLLRVSPLIIVICLLPALIYTANKEKSEWTGWAMLSLMSVEIVVLLLKIKLDLAGFLSTSSLYVGGQIVPIGDIRVVLPAFTVVIALILFSRKPDINNKWLAGIIAAGALATVGVADPAIFKMLVGSGIQQLFYYIR